MLILNSYIYTYMYIWIYLLIVICIFIYINMISIHSHVWMETPDANVQDARQFMDLVNEHLAPHGLFARYLNTYIDIYVYIIYICVCMYIYSNMHVYLCISIYIYTHTCVYIYLYSYIFKFFRGLYNHSPSFVWDVSFFVESTGLARQVAEFIDTLAPKLIRKVYIHAFKLSLYMYLRICAYIRIYTYVRK
jgi:hypothetical protein